MYNGIIILVTIVILLKYSKLNLIYRYYITNRPYREPIKQRDFPQYFMTLDLKEYYKELVKLSEGYRIKSIEEIEYKNQKYPILEININSNQETTNKKLLIIAGVHGNETGGTLAILEILKAIKSNPNHYQKWSIKIVSPINPVGTIELSRYNKDGYDLNRGIRNSKRKDILLQRNLVNNFKPNIILSFHEAPSDDFLVHPNECVKINLLKKVLEDIQMGGISLAKKDYWGRELKQNGISQVNGIVRLILKLTHPNSLDDYSEENKIAQITTESGWNSSDYKQRVESHLLLFKSVINNF